MSLRASRQAGGIRRRANAWKEVLWTPAGKVVAFVTTAYAILQWLYAHRVEVLTPEAAAALDRLATPAKAALQQWSLKTWAIVVLAALVLVLLEGAYRAVNRIENRLTAIQKERPLVRQLVLSDPQQSRDSTAYLEVVNEGAAAIFHAELICDGLDWPASQRFALWSSHQDYRCHIPEGARAQIALAQRRFDPSTGAGEWIFLDWVAGPREVNVPPPLGRGYMTIHKGRCPSPPFTANEATRRDFTVHIVLYAEPAMLNGPLRTTIRFRGPVAEVMT